MDAGVRNGQITHVRALNHVLKQRMQCRLTHLPELVEKLRGLVKEQINEVDRMLIGVGDVHLHHEYANFNKANAEWC